MRASYGVAGQAAGDGSRLFPGRKRNPQTTAWLVLSTAFAVFWVLIIGAFLGGQHYYETATVPEHATLSLESGIVLFRDAVTSTVVNATDNMEFREGDVVMVGQGASASLSMFGGTKIKLYSGSEIALKEMEQSRFHDGFSRIAIQVDKGTTRFLVGSPPMKSNEFLVTSPYGSAELAPGNYGVEVSDNQTRVSAREGSASVSGNGAPVALTDGEKAILTATGVSGPAPEGDPLIQNGDFAQGFSNWTPIDRNEPGRPVEPGQRTLVPENIDGRQSVALHVQRLSPQETHNETGLAQSVNKDVSDYVSLRLKADVKVTGQSLSGGGYMGYEYPMMIRVRYRDDTGGQIDWTHGFFASNPDNSPTPNGEQVPRGQWVSYDGELMEISPRPVYVISVEILGAGHTFDGSIANVSLVGK